MGQSAEIATKPWYLDFLSIGKNLMSDSLDKCVNNIFDAIDASDAGTTEVIGSLVIVLTHIYLSIGETKENCLETLSCAFDNHKFSENREGEA